MSCFQLGMLTLNEIITGKKRIDPLKLLTESTATVNREHCSRKQCCEYGLPVLANFDFVEQLHQVPLSTAPLVGIFLPQVSLIKCRSHVHRMHHFVQ